MSSFSGTSGAAFWCSSASSWMFTVKTETKWSFPLLRISGACYWQERKFDFSLKTYRRAPTGIAEVLRWRTVLLLWCRVGPPASGDMLKHVPADLLRDSSPPTLSQGWVYKVRPPVGLKNSWYAIKLRLVICLPVHRWCRTDWNYSNSLQPTEGTVFLFLIRGSMLMGSF